MEILELLLTFGDSLILLLFLLLLILPPFNFESLD